MAFDKKRKGFDLENYLRGKKYQFPIVRNQDLESFLLLAARIELELLFSLLNFVHLQRWLPGIEFDGKWISNCGGYRIELQRLFYNPNSITKSSNKFPFRDDNYFPDELKYAYFILIRIYCLQNNLYQLNNEMNINIFNDKLAVYYLSEFFKIDKTNMFNEIVINEYSTWQRSFLNNRNSEKLPGKNYHFYGENKIILYSLVETYAILDKEFIRLNINQLPVLLPLTYWQKSQEIWSIGMHIMPSGKHPLYNLHLIKKNSHAIILLTEFIDWAEHYCPSESDFETEVVWTSWYGGESTIDYVKWDDLYGRTVYYVLTFFQYNAKERIGLALKLYEKFISNPYLKFKIVLYGVNPQYDTRYNSIVSVFEDENQKWKCFDSNTFENQIEIGKDSYKILAGDSLFDFADKWNVYISEGLQIYRNRFLFDIKVEKYKKPKFLIEPIVKYKSLLVMYSPAGIGKSWLSMSCGLALANGVNVFEGWNVNKSAHVYFVSGEMDLDELNNRIYTLKNTYYSEKADRCQFILRRVKMDLSNREDQLKIEKDIRDLESDEFLGKKISLLIFDNLTTLVPKGSYMSNFDIFFDWLDILKSQNYTIILVHHSNRSSSFLGTSAIKNKTDFLIKLDPYDKKMITQEAFKLIDDGLAKDTREAMSMAHARTDELLSKNDVFFYLVPEKLRSVSKKSVSSIKMILNPSVDTKWKIEYMDNKNEDQLQIIGELSDKDNMHHKKITELSLEDKGKCILRLRNQNMKSPEMAKYLRVSKRTIATIRKETNTKESNLVKDSRGFYVKINNNADFSLFNPVLKENDASKVTFKSE